MSDEKVTDLLVTPSSDAAVEETWDEMVERIIRGRREAELRRDFELLSIEADDVAD